MAFFEDNNDIGLRFTVGDLTYIVCHGRKNGTSTMLQAEYVAPYLALTVSSKISYHG